MDMDSYIHIYAVDTVGICFCYRSIFSERTKVLSLFRRWFNLIGRNCFIRFHIKKKGANKYTHTHTKKRTRKTNKLITRCFDYYYNYTIEREKKPQKKQQNSYSIFIPRNKILQFTLFVLLLFWGSYNFWINI